MKALVFVIIAASFTSVCFAQNCGLVEADADSTLTDTWLDLTLHLFSDRTNPLHWEDKRAGYYINHSSCPLGAVGAILAAANTWNQPSWKGANDFSFHYRGDTPNYADNKDGQSVISFQPLNSANANTLARTYVKDFDLWPPHWPKDRLKEVDVAFDVNKYWAFAPTANHYDIESVALHEFGHWLVIDDLDHGPYGCDEFTSAVMYKSIGANVSKRILHWIDNFGKWYIYSSGDVPMAPPGMLTERFSPPLQSAADVLHTRLLHNYPDPFNPETWIPFELDHDANVTIDIYDSNGELVRTLAVGDKPKGSYVEQAKAVHWDGKNNNGKNVASGVYFYTLQTDDYSQTRRMVILK